jgi:hypothetical protein
VGDVVVTDDNIEDIVVLKVQLVVGDDMLTIELLVAEVDDRLAVRLPEDETTVWRVVALDMDGSDKELLEALPFVD